MREGEESPPYEMQQLDNKITKRKKENKFGAHLPNAWSNIGVGLHSCSLRTRDVSQEAQ